MPGHLAQSTVQQNMESLDLVGALHRYVHPRSQGLFPTPPPQRGKGPGEKALGTRMRYVLIRQPWRFTIP